MKVYIRSDKDEVTIEGYVNAVERNSKPLFERGVRFIERIAAGAFGRAIKRASVIQVLSNHDPRRVLGDTSSNLELEEDSIGLHARFTTSDPETVEDARNGNLVGWSFGYRDMPDGFEQMIDPETGLPLRKVNDLELFEVSLLNRKKTPAYAGTLVNVRDNGETEEVSIMYAAEEEAKPEIREIGEETTSEPETPLEERAEEPGTEEAPKEEAPAPETKEVTSEYFASYKNMIADMKA